METSYLFNKESGVWSRDDKNAINYSDGNAIETRILSALKNCADVSSKSDELFEHIQDWPSQYHFSRTRHNLLRPFTFNAQDNILELGAGCGNLTRYLGETQAQVVAVEGARMRATIAAARCRDLPNVSVYQDNIQHFASDKKFNVATLIGVLEYSRLYIKAEDPVQACLNAVKKHLTEEGVLYLAIENQLGIKYFNGASEDHQNIPYFGLNDLYAQDTAVTFGKRELTQILQKAGFAQIDFFYPFPDYKMTTVVFSEAGLNCEHFSPDQLIARTIAQDYTGNVWRNFFEPLIGGVLARNRLFGDLSNSFLVAARLKPTTKTVNWLAKTYNTERLNYFCTETTFSQQEEGIFVDKTRLFNINAPQEKELTLNFAQRVPYRVGKLYFTEILQINALGGEAQLNLMAQWLKHWVNYLFEHAVNQESATTKDWHHAKLPYNFIDCTPFNLIMEKNGTLIYIDQEWEFKQTVPLYSVIFRGIYYTIKFLYAREPICQLTYRQIIEKILADLGLELTEEVMQRAVQLEAAFLTACLPESCFKDIVNQKSLRTVISGYKCTLDLPAQVKYLTEKLAYFERVFAEGKKITPQFEQIVNKMIHGEKLYTLREVVSLNMLKVITIKIINRFKLKLSRLRPAP